MGSNFVGQNRVRAPSATHVCEACAHICARLSPVPGRLPGDCSRCDGWCLDLPYEIERAPTGDDWIVLLLDEGEACPKCEGSGLNANGGCFRNYCHLVEGDSYVTASKGEKPVILDFLRREKSGPWFAAIAESGQKHLLPWVPINPRGGVSGRVLFEEREIQLPAAQHPRWDLIAETASLLTAGATKEEIGRGEYGSGAWQRCGDAVRAYEQRWSGERGGAWLDLCLWLAQRDEEVVQTRMAAEQVVREEKKRGETGREKQRGSAGVNGRGAPRGKARVPPDERVEPAQAVGPDPRPDAGIGTDLREPGGVDHLTPAQPASVSTGEGQLDLFGGAGDGSPKAGRRPRVA